MLWGELIPQCVQLLVKAVFCDGVILPWRMTKLRIGGVITIELTLVQESLEKRDRVF